MSHEKMKAIRRKRQKKPVKEMKTNAKDSDLR